MTRLVDRDLESACALEAVMAFDRYLALGIDPGLFAVPDLRSVAEAAQDAWEAGDPPGIESVARSLQRAGKLDAIGGVRGLSELLVGNGVPDASRMRELAALRAMRAAALEVARHAESADLQAAQAALASARDGAIEQAAMGRVHTAGEMAIRMTERLVSMRSGERIIHPGFFLLERAIGGLPLGSLTVVGAATNVGKTSFGLEMCLRTASRNVGSGFVSHEDPEDLITARLLGSVAGISSRALMLGKLQDAQEFSRLAQAATKMQDLSDRLLASSTVGGTELDVCAAMSRMAMRGAKLIVVDYLQAIDSSKRQQDRRNEVRWLTSRLKAHAQRLGVALVLLSQLSRPPKGDEGREPSKHDLKEAGDVENAAEFIVMLWRTIEDDHAPISVKLTKSKIGSVGVRWDVQRDHNGRLFEVENSFVTPGKERSR